MSSEILLHTFHILNSVKVFLESCMLSTEDRSASSKMDSVDLHLSTLKFRSTKFSSGSHDIK